MKKLALIEEVLKIAGVKLEIDVCRQFWKLLWHLKSVVKILTKHWAKWKKEQNIVQICLQNVF